MAKFHIVTAVYVFGKFVEFREETATQLTTNGYKRWQKQNKYILLHIHIQIHIIVRFRPFSIKVCDEFDTNRILIGNFIKKLKNG